MSINFPSRAPHGARGLKLKLIYFRNAILWSRSAWGAWIETPDSSFMIDAQPSRAPHGARGLKPDQIEKSTVVFSRAPHGARGLKQTRKWQDQNGQESRSAWGAWIETSVHQERLLPVASSRSAWGAWIETPLTQ